MQILRSFVLPLLTVCWSAVCFSQYELYEKVEIQLDMSVLAANDLASLNLANAYDKDEVEIVVTVNKPDGTYEIINAFYFELYDFASDNSVNHPDWPYLPADRVIDIISNFDGWYFRYAPRLIGGHSYSVQINLPSQGLSFPLPVSLNTFQVVANSNKYEYGHVYLKDGVLQHNNTVGFNPVGLNIPIMPEGNFSLDNSNEPRWSYYDKFFRRLQENNANFARIWINFWSGVHLLGKNPDEGSTWHIDTYSQSHSAILDQIILAAEQRGVKVQFCFFNANNLDTRENSSGNSVWNNLNGFNSANGGPCETPVEFYTSPEALRMQKNLIRYCIDRWGHSKAILSWELINEADAVSGIKGQNDQNLQLISYTAVLRNWHQELGATVHQNDVYKSPLTSSFLINSILDVHVDCFKAMDFVSLHRYVFNLNNIGEESSKIWKDHVDDWYFNSGIEDLVFQFGEAESLCDELAEPPFDLDALTADTNDPMGYAFHNDLWSSAFNGSLGPIMVWELDHLLDGQSPGTPAGKALEAFRGIGGFYKNMPYVGRNDFIHPHFSAESDKIRSHYMTFLKERRTYGWMQDENFRNEHLIDFTTRRTLPYVTGMNPNDAPVRAKEIPDLELSSAILDNGSNKIIWYDTETGEVAQVENAVVRHGKDITLMIPDMLRDSPFGDAAFEIRPVQCGWNEELTLDGAEYSMMDAQLFTESNGNFYFPNADGAICEARYTMANGWTVEILNGQAPTMKSSVYSTKGLTIHGNALYYIGADKIPYQLYEDQGSWQYVPMINSNSIWKAKQTSELHYRNGNLYYVSAFNGRLVELMVNGSSWSVNPLWNSVNVAHSSGFALADDAENSIYYCADGGQLYRAYKQGGFWMNENIGGNNPMNRASANAKVRYKNGMVFYQRVYDDKIMHLYQSNGVWESQLLTENAPPVLSGSDFYLDNDAASSIYTIGFDHNIYRLYVDMNNDWRYEQFNIEHANSQGAVGKIVKPGEKLHYAGEGNRLFNLFDCQLAEPTAPNPNLRTAWKSDEMESITGMSIELHPNPNNGTFVLKASGAVFNKVELLDISGKIIATKCFGASSEKRLYFNNLKNGHYLMRVYSITGESKVIRFVKT